MAPDHPKQTSPTATPTASNLTWPEDELDEAELVEALEAHRRKQFAELSSL